MEVTAQRQGCVVLGQGGLAGGDVSRERSLCRGHQRHEAGLTPPCNRAAAGWDGARGHCRERAVALVPTLPGHLVSPLGIWCHPTGALDVTISGYLVIPPGHLVSHPLGHLVTLTGHLACLGALGFTQPGHLVTLAGHLVHLGALGVTPSGHLMSPSPDTWSSPQGTWCQLPRHTWSPSQDTRSHS